MEIRKLNMLRGLAALIVVISHFSNITNGFFGGYLGSGAGQIGVMIFFVLSGFLMSFLYLDRSFNFNNIISYCIARVARIAPLFIILVAGSYLLHIFGFKQILYKIPDLASFISHLLLMSGDSVLWTIPAEVFFYLAFIPLWGIYQKKKGLFYAFLILILFLLICLKFPRIKGSFLGAPYDIWFFRALPYFIVGILFGILYKEIMIPAYLKNNYFIVGFLIFPFLYPKVFNEITGYNYRLWVDFEILFLLSVGFFILAFLLPDKNIIFANLIGDFLGKISYSLYLLHLPILWQVKNFGIDSVILEFIIFIFLALSISYISYILLENPSRKYFRSLNINKSRSDN